MLIRMQCDEDHPPPVPPIGYRELEPDVGRIRSSTEPERAESEPARRLVVTGDPQRGIAPVRHATGRPATGWALRPFPVNTRNISNASWRHSRRYPPERRLRADTRERGSSRPKRYRGRSLLWLEKSAVRRGDELAHTGCAASL